MSDFNFFLSANYNKFAVECGWNSKITKNVGNLWFLGGKVDFSEKKRDFFPEIIKGGKFAVELVENDIF